MKEEAAKLATLMQELRATHREKDRNIAKILRLILEVMADPRHTHRAAMSTIVRGLITSLEKE